MCPQLVICCTLSSHRAEPRYDIHRALTWDATQDDKPW